MSDPAAPSKMVQVPRAILEHWEQLLRTGGAEGALRVANSIAVASQLEDFMDDLRRDKLRPGAKDPAVHGTDVFDGVSYSEVDGAIAKALDEHERTMHRGE